MTDRRHQVVRVCELTVSEDVIRDITFEDVQFIGPAVVVFQNCTLEHSTFEGDIDAVLWELAPGRERVVGAVVFQSCQFLKCRFSRIGIAGPKEGLAVFRQALRAAETP